MFCKGKMNFAAGERKWREPASADSRHYARCVLGEGSGQNRLTVPQPWTPLDKKEMLSGFANSGLASLLGGDRTDFDGVAIQSSRHGGVLAG
jgi:hypothetical protein